MSQQPPNGLMCQQCPYKQESERHRSASIVSRVKLFQIYWTGYEDYQPYTFAHESKTDDEFESEFIMMMRKYGDKYLQQEDSWASAPNWIRFIVDRMHELGYQKIEPSKAVGAFGAYIIESKKDDDAEFGKIIGDELLDKAVQHNIEIRRAKGEM